MTENEAPDLHPGEPDPEYVDPDVAPSPTDPQRDDEPKNDPVPETDPDSETEGGSEPNA